MATRKVKRFNEGGEGYGEGYGFGETGGGANAPGTGGNIPGGGYDSYDSYDSDGDNSNLTSRRVMAGDTTSRFPGAPSSAPVSYGRTTIAPEAEAAPVNAPPGYFGRVTIAPEAEDAPVSSPVGRYGRTTIAPDSSPEEAASHRQSMQAIADGVTAQGNSNAGSFNSNAGSFNSNDRAKGGMIKKYDKGGSINTKKLKYKDIYTKEMGDPPENNDMGSAAKPPKQDMGAGAGRGGQGGPTAKELSDYTRKKNEQKVDATIYMKEKGQPPMDPEYAYAKGGMASDKGKHKMPDGKMMKNSAMVKKYAKGGMVSSASSRGDGIAVRGKTRGRLY